MSKVQGHTVTPLGTFATAAVRFDIIHQICCNYLSSVIMFEANVMITITTTYLLC